MDLRRGEQSDPVAMVALVCGLTPLGALLISIPALVIGGMIIALGALVLSGVSVPLAIGFGVAGVVRAGRRQTSAGVAGVGLGLGVLWLMLVGAALAWFYLLGGGKVLAASFH